MLLVEPPKCPHCGEPVSAADLRREFGRRHTFFDTTKWGIRCPVCKAVLKLRKGRTYALAVLFYGTALIGWTSLSTYGPALDSEARQVLVLALTVAWVLVYLRWAPLFAQLEEAGPDEKIQIHKSPDEQLAEDPQYQAELKEAEEQSQWTESVNDPSRKPWRCASCGEEVPATFDICWKCQKPKPSPEAA